MATHSSILGFPARKIPRTKEPGGPQSMGSQSFSHRTEATEHIGWNFEARQNFIYALNHCALYLQMFFSYKHSNTAVTIDFIY